MPAATKKSEQRTFRNRTRVNALFGFVITEFLSRRFYPELLKVVNIFRQRSRSKPVSPALRDGPDFATHRQITAHGRADPCRALALPSPKGYLVGDTWN